MTDRPSPTSTDAKAQEPAGFDLPAPTAGAPARAYQVLARKYRPSSFEDLIGQEAMVRTLTNAFALERIHQAYLLTGVRGVGKTTTARILARAFNYELPAGDGQPAIDRPTIHMPAPGVHCQAIIESRHVDVIEMDAASHTGVDDVRDIIDNARYRPVLARCKVYIIDEVHMLSRNAFNALLKTLEEPPEHVRFLFATTEIEKVPVTVRSRCQRFDLRRVGADLLIAHLEKICLQEGVAIDREALALIARAAEGSVRDALSLLDQAIALGGAGLQGIGEEHIRNMLGVGSRSRIVDLFEAVMNGDAGGALAIFKDEYDGGADPLLMLTDLAEFIHFVTRLKLAPAPDLQIAVTEDERTRGAAFSASLSVQTLTLAWQIVSRGLSDVKSSPRPLAAGDMVLVRLAFAASLPTPEDAIRRLAANPAPEGATAARQASSPAPAGALTDTITGAMAATPAGAAPDPAPLRAAGMAVAHAIHPAGATAVRAPSPSPSPAPSLAPSLARSPAPSADLAPASVAAVSAGAAARVRLRSFEDVVALAHMRRDIQLKYALERDVRLIRFEPGTIEFALSDGASTQLAAQLGARLLEWTGERWTISVASDGGAPSLRELAEHRERERLTGVRSDPLVRSALAAFPGAEIVAVRMRDGEDDAFAAGPPPAAGADEIAFDDAIGQELDEDSDAVPGDDDDA